MTETEEVRKREDKAHLRRCIREKNRERRLSLPEELRKDAEIQRYMFNSGWLD